ncbi:MBL fold metallo-hydrolase [Caulobacter sp. BP25]|uniref:MBL fold metallo-hydrolase n=1 Tax=Caulobacter sp. BP25 TaxID=2048900 RepID=UPI000C12B673|nr:3',5'-cyclic-nucleotide phosphodiesterase [Caulobacter sp. BP25]PHY21540.1 3',5'-cyclic-nucleotide phosphodiesterase [Caulobacter sp. BP25]
MRRRANLRALLPALLLLTGAAPPSPAFDLVALGVNGGIEEPTSAYHITARGARSGVMCDAGTLAAGIDQAQRRGGYPRAASRQEVMASISAYLITHAHLDHVAGLVLASPNDTKKDIMALAPVNQALADHYFNWSAWPNMGDRGAAPRLARYHYRDLEPGGPPTLIAGTAISVTAYRLSHAGSPSTAFLLQSGSDALLCLGDTGPDAVEGSTHLNDLWRAVAPLVQQGRLRGILIEASYPDPVPDNQLYGHLTPSWLGKELQALRGMVGNDARMKALPILVTHIKPSEAPPSNRETVSRQLHDLGFFNFIIMEQGRPYAL